MVVGKNEVAEVAQWWVLAFVSDLAHQTFPKVGSFTIRLTATAS